MLFFVLAAIHLVLIYFLPLNITSGDGAELVTAIALNGIAHPSGYPFYTILSKIITFIPIGTIAFRVSLFSSTCSIISLYLIYKIIFKLAKSKTASYFGVISLFLSYSFFYQSLFQKFYTLNLLLILTIFYIGIILIKDGYSNKLQMLLSFILGLTFSCHHSGLFMVIPLIFIAIIYFRNFLHNLLYSFLFFFIGAVINFYIFVKMSIKAFTFFPLPSTYKNIIYNYIFRGIYSGDTIESLKSSYAYFSNYYYTTINIIKIIQTNFPLYFTYLFFILGLIYLYNKNKKIFIFVLTTLFSYSILLGKLTFTSKQPTIVDYYVIANQYFLPMLSLFAIINGIGLAFLINTVKPKFKILHLIIAILPIFYLIIFPIRLKDNLWSRNLAVYQSRIDRIFTKPINSLYLTIGDNHIFQTGYLKKIANFRNDICQLYRKSIKFSYSINCYNRKQKIDEYKMIISNDFFMKNYDILFPNCFATTDIQTIFPNFINVKFLSDYLLILKNNEQNSLINDNFEPFFQNNLDNSYIKFKLNKHFNINLNYLKDIFKNFFNYLPCLEHHTDDYFTYGSCYSTYIDNEAILYKTREKLTIYNSSLNPYILNDPNLRKNFTEYEIK